MKFLPLLLLNLATVAVALAVYDQVRGAPPPTEGVASPAPAADPGLERRVAALEADRGPALVASGRDDDLRARVEALEAALTALGKAAPPPPDEPTRAAPRRAAGPAAAEPDPAPEEIARFRKLAEAVRRQERIEQNRARVDRALDKLSLSLSKRQRERIHAAFEVFQPRVKQIWTRVKDEARETIAAGGEVDRKEIVGNTTALIQQEFASTLEGVVAPADAEAVAKVLLPGGR